MIPGPNATSTDATSKERPSTTEHGHTLSSSSTSSFSPLMSTDKEKEEKPSDVVAETLTKNPTPQKNGVHLPWIKSLVVTCFLLSLAGSGERFGDKAFSGVQLHPAYQRHLGIPNSRFPKAWASVIDPGDCIGQIIGALLAGWLCEAFGNKQVRYRKNKLTICLCIFFFFLQVVEKHY